MMKATAEKSAFASELSRLERNVPRGEPLWLRRLRSSSLARFRELDFPKPQDEEWRQTDISPLLRIPFRPAAPGAVRPTARDLNASGFADLECPRLVFVNGHHAPELSSLEGVSPGVWAGSLIEALRSRPEQVEPHLGRHAAHRERAFTALATSHMDDGGVVLVSEGTVVEQPIHLVYVTASPGEPVVSFPRTLIAVGGGSQAVVVETFIGLGGDDVYFTCPVSEIVVGENSVVDHYRVQRESEQAYHIATLQTNQARDSRLLSLNICLGARLARNDVGATLDGEGTECTLNGLYVARDGQHVDNHTSLDHARPRSVSHELYKGVLTGASRAVFNGRIIVRPGAQKTDAKQSNRNLLLSEGALVHTRPQLEIYADDVKCTHGATIGQLDADALFYLRSRGIGRDEARSLLIHAFAASVLREIKIEILSKKVDAEITARLQSAPGEGAR